MPHSKSRHELRASTDPRAIRREQASEQRAEQFLRNHRLRGALAPSHEEALSLERVRACLDEGAKPEGAGLGDGEDVGSALNVLIRARPDTETARAVVRLLLERDADVHFRCEARRRGVLHTAAENGWKEPGLRLLVDAGANPRQGDREGNTPLHLLTTPMSERRGAFWEKRGDLLNHLVAAWVAVGADVNARNQRGEAPLDRVFATQKPGRMEAARMALRAGMAWTRRATRLLQQSIGTTGPAFFRDAQRAEAEALIAEGRARNLAQGLEEELPEAAPVTRAAKPRL